MKRVSVLIVGAGPTGLTLACDLARRGIAVRVVEKAPRLFIGSRAKGLQPRTLEVFDDLGVLDAVIDGGAPFLHFGSIRAPPWSGNEASNKCWGCRRHPRRALSPTRGHGSFRNGAPIAFCTTGSSPWEGGSRPRRSCGGSFRKKTAWL